MSFINRKWTPAHADEWTKEDWITIVISPICYILLSLGIGLSMLLLPVGFIVLAAGIILTIIMHWIIDPKLKMISEEYEKKQKEYLETLERNARWEEHNG
jgi:antibiotic biosynthesis monooxygenase (ABM) superfamily enzyme